MTALQYRAALKQLGFDKMSSHPSDEGLSAAAPFLCTVPRTSRRWARLDGNGPPPLVAKFLRLMVELEMKPEDLD